MRRDSWNFPWLHYANPHDVMFGPRANIDRDLLNLAMRIIRGDELTLEDLQLQQNEPEALEKMLRELKEFMEK